MDRRTCARCGELDGEIFPLSAMNQGENAPPLHPRCRCTIVATFDSPGKRSKTSGERAARDENGRRTRVPADMTYKDWQAVYIDKSKTFDTWQKEMEAKYAAMPPTREQLRGREIIDKLSSGAPLTSIKPNDKVATGALNDKNDPDGKRREAHAIMQYETRRNSKKEPWVKRIAQNSGMSEKAISKIFDHVFVKEHDLWDGRHTFDPSYYMAESFRRLHEGKNIQPHDLLMLKHEWLEASLMERYDYDYDTAHNITDRKYNYSVALDKWRKEHE